MSGHAAPSLFVRKYKLYIFVFVLLSIVGFITLGLPGLNGEIGLQTYSDSLTYERLSRNMPSGLALISVSSNLVGPIAILRIFDYSYSLIFAFNVALFLLSLKIIFSSYDLNKSVFLFFICASPLMFFSLFNVNKEMLLLFDIALFLSYLKNKRLLVLLLTVAVSVLIRWQVTLFVLVALPLLMIDRFFGYRKVIVFGIVAGLSIVYPMLYNVFEAVIIHSLPDNDAVRGSGIFQTLNKIQNSTGGYMLVFVPKLLQINFGIIKRFHMITEFDMFWSYFVLMLHSVASLLLTFYLVFKRRFMFDNKLIYLSMVFAAIFALSPIINVRYFLPLYIMFAVVASSRLTELRRCSRKVNRNTAADNQRLAANSMQSGAAEPPSAHS